MWSLMFAGKAPFSINPISGKLRLELVPILPGWLFDENGEASFTFLGSIRVTYRGNKAKVDTWKIQSPSLVKRLILLGTDGNSFEIEGGVIEGTVAESVRDLKIANIEVFFT